jgi:LysM repeat protein
LNKLKFPLSESVVSMLLGAVVVLLVGLLAYNYFRANKPATPPLPKELETEEAGTPPGQLASPSAAVALPTVHNVMAGETLWSIAEKYYQSGYNYVDIAQTNQLSNPGNIAVGQKLTIPTLWSDSQRRPGLKLRRQSQPTGLMVALTP